MEVRQLFDKWLSLPTSCAGLSKPPRQPWRGQRAAPAVNRPLKGLEDLSAPFTTLSSRAYSCGIGCTPFLCEDKEM